MPNKRTIITFLGVILCVAIVISVVIISNNLNKQSSSNSKDSASVQATNNSINSSESGKIPVYPNDNDKTKKNKETYNSIAEECDKLSEDYARGKISREEFYKRGDELRQKLDATGINPKDYETPEHRYEEQYSFAISDAVMLDNDCKDKNGKVIPEYKEKYELNIKRKEYIGKVYDDYKAGKISAEEAEKSLANQYTLIK